MLLLSVALKYILGSALSLCSLFTASLYVCDEAVLLILYLGVARSAPPRGAEDCTAIPPSLKAKTTKCTKHKPVQQVC